MDFTYEPENICAMQIKFHMEGNIVTNIQFIGGCNGNLKAIAKLVNGWTVEKIEEYLKGNLCGRKPTSCADQLAIAVRKAYNKMHAAAV